MDEKTIKIEINRIATKYGLSPFYEEERYDRVILYDYQSGYATLVKFNPDQMEIGDFAEIDKDVRDGILDIRRTAMEGQNISDCLLVSFDDTHGVDETVLLVGRKRSDGSVGIIEEFYGKEAEDLYSKLTTPVKKV